MRYLSDSTARPSYLCFHKNCAGPNKLIPRAWRDERCPDYVSCQTQLLFGGNVSAGPAKIEQDCLAGQGAGLLFRRESVVGVNEAKDPTEATGLWGVPVELLFAAAALFLVLFAGVVVSSLPRPGRGG
jgi:hypothetical protein